MSLLWHQRKTRLAELLGSSGDEDADGSSLDRLMHGQNVIGKTAKTAEIDTLRFKDRDLDVVGTLEYGQFGVIDVVTCRLNNCVYVRKSIEKKFALRTRDQCSPQFERDLLLQALKTESPWAPHLLCAFQTPTHLKLVMDYAEGGTLWDVLESSPYEGRIHEADLRWWMPQVVSAIYWCHSQGFAHRDIKPHNFVLTPDAHILLIDFGSAAPLLPPNEDGSQVLPKGYCLVPCGTCDYISPEILRAHEEALVALEMDDDEVPGPNSADTEGYGVETDWWSMGAMLYEMAYGAAPFFAPDIRSTYLRIMNHERSLKFDQSVNVSTTLQHFLHRLLTNANQRLGRRNVMEITDHPIFEGVEWSKLSFQTAPTDLHLPQFVYSEPKAPSAPKPAPKEQSMDESDSHSQGFAFSALFQSSAGSPAITSLRPSPISRATPMSASKAATNFIGFSWGPPIDAFPDELLPETPRDAKCDPLATPRPLFHTPAAVQQTPNTLSVPLTWGPGAFSTPGPLRGFSTPMRPYAVSPHATLPRTSTVRRTAPRRTVSDREAMKQLVDCVGMSARKKVLESGKKPKLLNMFIPPTKSKSSSGNGHGHGGSGKSTSSGGTKKDVRFDRIAMPIPAWDHSGPSEAGSRHVGSRSNSISRSFSKVIAAAAAASATNGQNDVRAPSAARAGLGLHDDSDIYYYSTEVQPKVIDDCDGDTNHYQHEEDYDPAHYSSTETTDSEHGGPPSPSPSPRPGSAMSMMSMTRRTSTPTFSGYLNGPLSSAGHSLTRMRSGSWSGLVPLTANQDRDRSTNVTATMTMTGHHTATTSTNPTSNVSGLGTDGLLTIPSAGLFGKEVRLSQPPIGTSSSGEPRKSNIVVPQSALAPHPEEAYDAYDEGGVDSRPRLRPSNQSSGSKRTVSNPLLNEMERRHVLMMRDIERLEERFDRVLDVLGR